MKGIAVKGGKAIATSIGVIATALTGIVVAGVKSSAYLEQNLGGVQTLFTDLKTGASSAQQVIENANKAYSTAQLSANQYMETVTSFAASLKQSVGGNMQAMAEYANKAVVDMADNANKMRNFDGKHTECLSRFCKTKLYDA